MFLADTISSGRNYEVQQKLEVVLKAEKTADALITKMRHMKKKIQKDQRGRARAFILRKDMSSMAGYLQKKKKKKRFQQA